MSAVSKVYWPSGTRVRVYQAGVGKRFKSGVLVTDLLIGATHAEVRVGRRTEAVEADRLFLATTDKS